MNSDEETIALTADNLRALAHPLRVQLLGLLRRQGPATATQLAAQLGLTSGALSYHLRQLERYGFVLEDDARGNRRDRWWRAAHRYTQFDRAALDPDAEAAGEAYEEAVIATVSSSLARAHAERPGLPAEWRRVFNLSDTLLVLSAAEAEQLGNELWAVLLRYRRHTAGEPVPDGMRVIEARFQVYPAAVGTTNEVHLS